MKITEHKQSLEIIRQKCETRQTDFNAEELRHLNLVYLEIQNGIGKTYTRPIDTSCGSCVISAMNVVHNYIKFHELNNKEEKDGKKEDDNQSSLGIGTTLKELREKHPHIKATSVEAFLQKLNEENKDGKESAASN